MNQEVKDWLEYAKMDLDGAELLNTAKYPKPVELVCYHCQQCGEKAVKTLIVHYGFSSTMPKTHDINFLLDQIKNKVKVPNDIYNHAAYLTKYGVETRYPNSLDLTEDDADLVIKYANEIYDWTKSIVGSEN